MTSSSIKYVKTRCSSYSTPIASLIAKREILEEILRTRLIKRHREVPELPFPRTIATALIPASKSPSSISQLPYLLQFRSHEHQSSPHTTFEQCKRNTKSPGVIRIRQNNLQQQQQRQMRIRANKEDLVHASRRTCTPYPLRPRTLRHSPP